MSGWGHSECPSTRVSGKDWTKRVLNIADIVGHTLSADSEKDQGIKGQFHASHAEKQLIAYFLDRHVFLPEDKIPDPRFDEKIAHLKREMEDMASQYPIIQQLYRLQEQKEQLEYELFDKDDRLLGEEYDNELVKCLKTQIARLSEIIASLETRSEVERIRARERQIQVCKHEKAVHGRLNRISNMAQKDTLRRAAKLISAPKYEICTDCLLFKDNVNRIFGLSLELHECTQ
ncbi:uncharacterized protein LDX57_010076 [Aspergillus melleus]|uniref:uncharacterized protein n=1 Tax=Aspergillus melleus TaxID=138277 RepID=UPI001E8D33DE|nr:uncharacterized protein LDX57_010076 [Aspergillus melleus]KAH8432440.1 hypothetical protein LDX57_010076 [Aspergillus melleus]